MLSNSKKRDDFESLKDEEVMYDPMIERQYKTIEKSPRIPMKRINKHKNKLKPKKSPYNTGQRNIVDELKYQARVY